MIAITACLIAALAGPVKVPDAVADCPIGLVCFLPAEVGEISVKAINLERDLAIAKARGKRLGWTVGCGAGMTPEVQGGSVEANLRPVFCGAVWGLRW